MANVNADAARHSQDLQRMEAKRRAQIDNMRSSYENQLETKDAVQKDRVESMNKAFAKDKIAATESYNTRITSTQSEIAEKIKVMDKRNNKEFVQLRDSFEKEKIEMNKKFSRELANLKESYETIIQDKDRTIHELNYQKEYSVNYLSDRMEKKYTKLEETYQERLDEIKKKHESEIERLEKQLRNT